MSDDANVARLVRRLRSLGRPRGRPGRRPWDEVPDQPGSWDEVPEKPGTSWDEVPPP